MARERRQRADWDPALIIAQVSIQNLQVEDAIDSVRQIVSLQAAHYLVLCITTPLLLIIFAEKGSLEYEGGALNIGMLMDWREMAGRPTVNRLHGVQHRGWAPFGQPGSPNVSGSDNSRLGMNHSHDNDIRLAGVDPMRGWVIAATWLLASCAE
jgi:hypothetical protein